MSLENKPVTTKKDDLSREIYVERSSLEPHFVEHINQRLDMYKDLLKSLREVEHKSRFTSWIYPPLTRYADNAASLAWVFTGIKPAMLWEYSNRKMQRFLEDAGLSVVGQYIYDPNHVQHIMEENNDVEWISDDPHEVMRALGNDRLSEESLKRGVLLGFPREAVNSYTQHETLSDKHKELDRLVYRSPQSEEEQEAYDVLLGVKTRNEVDIEVIEQRLIHMLEEYEDAAPDVARLLASNFMRAQRGGTYGFYWMSYENHVATERKTATLRAIEEQTKWHSVVPDKSKRLTSQT